MHAIGHAHEQMFQTWQVVVKQPVLLKMRTCGVCHTDA